MKTLLIDDHPLILSALQLVIQGLDTHVSLVSVETAQKAREALAADAAFDLVLLDLRLGDADGFELLKELRAAYPTLSIVIVSASDSVADILRAIELGAMGFVPKRASNELLFEALTMVMSGGIYVPPMEMRSSASTPRDVGRNGVAGDRPPRAGDIASLGLTRRQTEVLMLLLRGQSNKLIARELNLSVETIKDHVAAVLRALNVSSRTQAVLAVSQMTQYSTLEGCRNGTEVS